MAATNPPLVSVIEHTQPGVQKPVFIEGLPGVGNVGKLAAEHLVDLTGATRWCTIHCRDFPPQVIINDDGTIRQVENILWVAPKACGGRDLVIMTGDFQPMTGPGQHAVVDYVLDLLEPLGCQELYTMGGCGLGTTVDDPDVLGAATDIPTVQKLIDLGVRFDEDEPSGGIIGVSGLFLGVGAARGFHGACLMGETSGYVVDPKAAQAVLEVVALLTGMTDVTFQNLDDKAAEMELLRAAFIESHGDGDGAEFSGDSHAQAP
jgi:uncharacterized protein (TIGR00162 family)